MPLACLPSALMVCELMMVKPVNGIFSFSPNSEYCWMKRTYDFMPGADAVRFIQQYTEFGLKEKMPLTGFTMIDSQTISTLGKSASA